jgi:hypothetical protein
MPSEINQGYPFAAVTRNPFNYVKVEQINRDVVTPWLTLDEITNQINNWGDESQDDYLKSLELATRGAVEDYLGMSIFSITYRVWYGTESLSSSPVALDLPEVSQNQYPSQPGVQIDAVGYYGADVPANRVLLASNSYQYDPSGNKVLVQNLPTDVNTSMTAPVFVEYTTAPNPLQTYPQIKQAALLLFTHLYNNRSNTTEMNLKSIPFGFETLLRPYKPLVM